MANYVGATAARLVRRLAYAKGSLAELTRLTDHAQAKLSTAASGYKRLRSQCRDVRQHISALEAELSTVSTMPTAEIRAVEARPRRSGQIHGTIIAELVRLLREAERPLTTNEIVLAMANRFTISLETPKARKATRRTFTSKLRMLIRKGAVERLHDPDGSDEGRWLWIGL